MVDIVIRATELSDCEGLWALNQCPKVIRGTMRMPYTSVAFLRKRLENMPANAYSLVAVEKAEKEADQKAAARIVGNVGLYPQTGAPRQHAAYLGIAVHDDYHGQGIGSQLMGEILMIADNWLNLKRLELSVFVDNAPAVHLYEKFGFEIEGTWKKYAFRDGAYRDAYTMARVM